VTKIKWSRHAGSTATGRACWDQLIFERRVAGTELRRSPRVVHLTVTLAWAYLHTYDEALPSMSWKGLAAVSAWRQSDCSGNSLALPSPSMPGASTSSPADQTFGRFSELTPQILDAPSLVA
jgi:hypothetical protein